MQDITPTSKDFMGAGLSFPLKVNAQTGRFEMSRHEENIHESVKMILQTYQGERVMRPEFGAVAGNVLFSDLSPTDVSSAESRVREALEEHEPRISNVSVKTHHENRGELSIEITYTVRTTNNLFSRVYPFYILEGAGA